MSNDDMTQFATISVQGYDFTMPDAVTRLLYFADDSSVASSLGIRIGMTIDPDSEDFDVTEISPSDPSIIYLDMPIKKPVDINDLPKPGLFPAYYSLSPKQKWVYLDWLQDSSQTIDIGYVFIYYYGLERHLMEGNFELAFDEIIHLCDHHEHRSFMLYSISVLFHSLLVRERFDRLDDIFFLTGANAWPGLGLLAQYYLNMDLSGRDLMDISKGIQGTNRRYIEMEPELFEAKLNKNIKSKYNNDRFPFSNRYEIADVPIRMGAFANYALSERDFGLPHFCDYQPFADEVKAILTVTHEEVKDMLKERRREKSWREKS